ncbi:bacillithiol biosynthesis cysteine-adding enzyme BshC [Heyndrickxia shackletonii]|uniref:Putative cysteine ligase BshC n=1 Tax=Heyndrickxia shackletonii TaxID=157838 RepID=A0A0Q3TL72_9BACI|nr:bacillithiol biosynthesis cysteine-adding enzyme BshC [Heyndrickxia shackletonii]KQL54728.1 bacillithiol biosynthesis cysteine-adding enzyme BshC [Heyndrickxia shackletonii]NEY98382.1 bacillithiol biosynthesis cysteine-adding enzyme BshC [Heyndrickxia shackletonii]
MDLENIFIPATNRFASLYIEQQKPVKDFFHYDITDQNVFEKRYKDIQSRTFEREKLADCIETYMKNFSLSNEIKESLDKLRQPASVVVIGGQQAGLLTGPLYTVHKLISIIHLAREQEQKLQVPVVPVFWIAGEDHDYLEVNHVFVEKDRSINKLSYAEGPIDKRMVSDVEFDQIHMKKWVKKVFEHFGETEYTNQLLRMMESTIDQSKTFVDFFSNIILSLFSKYGVLLIDSADKQLRKLEVPFFKQIIEQSSSITDLVLQQQEYIRSFDFSNTIEIGKNAVNLFYYDGKERILLDYFPEDECFIGKNEKAKFTKMELLTELENHPEHFSNNVVTRPMMEEWLFPTLAFIGGPGEIAYWAELKLAFEHMGFEMPPVIARLNLTILERSIDADMKELQLDTEKTVRDGVADERNKYWNSVKDETLDGLVLEARDWLENQYSQILSRSDKGIEPLIEKNLSIHLRQLEFLQRKINVNIEQKHDNVLEVYDRIERSLKPNNTPQERIWNIFYFINKYGQTFIDDLLSLPYEFDGTHKLIRL